MSLRLDEMTFDEVKKYYKKMFSDILSDSEFNKISKIYLEKYDEVNNYKDKGYKQSGGLGRGFKYTLNILYGWYIEELMFLALLKNKYVKSIEYTGDDAPHKFSFDHENKKILIDGEKTTRPDYLIKLKDGRDFFLELKTATANVFTIKRGNVVRLYQSMAEFNKYSIVIMIDIPQSLYAIHDINYFSNLHPFVNQRMEGQLCYQLPNPDKKFNKLLTEDFLSHYDKKIFNNHLVKCFKLQKTAEDLNYRNIVKIIKNKISIENKTSEFEFKKQEFEKEINKKKEQTPGVEYSWEKISDMINELKNKKAK